MKLTGQINKKRPPRQSLLDAWDRAVRKAMLLGDVERLEQLAEMALDYALVDGVMS